MSQNTRLRERAAPRSEVCYSADVNLKDQIADLKRDLDNLDAAIEVFERLSRSRKQTAGKSTVAGRTGSETDRHAAKTPLANTSGRQRD